MMLTRFVSLLRRCKQRALFLTTSAAASGIATLLLAAHPLRVSDRALKERITPVNPQHILDKMTALPINEWSHIGGRPDVRHMGPMAQDFAALFNLGVDDKHIDMLDSSGVALAAIQALVARLQTQQQELQALWLTNFWAHYNQASGMLHVPVSTIRFRDFVPANSLPMKDEKRGFV